MVLLHDSNMPEISEIKIHICQTEPLGLLYERSQEPFYFL